MSTMDSGRDMSSAWTGWIGFAAIMLAFIGAITFFEGLIAIIRDNYYVVTRQQVFLFDVSTWGWIMLFWGILLFLAALGLAAKSGWARWFTIIVVFLSLLSQLSFLGNAAVSALVTDGDHARDRRSLRAHGALEGRLHARVTLQGR